MAHQVGKTLRTLRIFTNHFYGVVVVPTRRIKRQVNFFNQSRLIPIDSG